MCIENDKNTIKKQIIRLKKAMIELQEKLIDMEENKDENRR